MIIFSCQNQIFENDIIFSCPWFRIRIKRWHKTTAQQHHLNFGLRCALHLSQHVWAEWIKHWNKIHFFNYEKLTKFFLCTRIPELSHTWTQTWWEWSQTWLSCRAPQRWSLPPQRLASHRSSPPAEEEQIKRVRLFYKKNQCYYPYFMCMNSNCLKQGHVAAASALTINLSKIFEYHLLIYSSTFQRYLNIIF